MNLIEKENIEKAIEETEYAYNYVCESCMKDDCSGCDTEKLKNLVLTLFQKNNAKPPEIFGDVFVCPECTSPVKQNQNYCSNCGCRIDL